MEFITGQLEYTHYAIAYLYMYLTFLFTNLPPKGMLQTTHMRKLWREGNILLVIMPLIISIVVVGALSFTGASEAGLKLAFFAIAISALCRTIFKTTVFKAKASPGLIFYMSGMRLMHTAVSPVLLGWSIAHMYFV